MENYKKNKFNSDLFIRPFSSNEIKANDEVEKNMFSDDDYRYFTGFIKGS